jgi:hypothetical protein
VLVKGERAPEHFFHIIVDLLAVVLGPKLHM